jgi:hypothetical protein
MRKVWPDRAMAYLRSDCYEHALADSLCFPADQKLSEKAYYRAALAFYKLGRFIDCHARITAFMAHYPDNSKSHILIHRLEQRLSEQKSSDFDFDALYMAVQQGVRDLDVATYKGLLVVQATKDRERGLFTPVLSVPASCFSAKRLLFTATHRLKWLRLLAT